VIKEDLQEPRLLFLGTEFGLYISIDGGERWAQFKGGRLPDVAVRDLVIQPQENDLVLATHGRGIWIVDDITPLRALSGDLLGKQFGVVPSRPAVQRLRTNGGDPTGAAVFIGDNPPDGAAISYYQRSRHLYGRLKIEILDANGKVIADLPASKRPGLNRIVWNMLEKPPHVPPAAQLAFSGTQGVRALPGNYTLRITDNGKAYESPLVVGIDPAATFTLADREAQHTAAIRVKKLFGNESKLMERITGLRAELRARRASARRRTIRSLGALKNLDDEVDVVRKRIVATTEGGAITGEERLREHTDQLYGAILSWEGKPTTYQQDNVLALEAEFERIRADFDALTAKKLPDLNKATRGCEARRNQVKPIDEDKDEDADEASANPRAGRADPDLAHGPASVSVRFQVAALARTENTIDQITLHAGCGVARRCPVSAHLRGREPSVASITQDLHWRLVGPFRGGRTRAVAGVPGQPATFLVGAVNGGVWKTDDDGRTWTPIFDAEPTQSIGAIAVAPSNPKIIYVASGEGLQRPDLSVGNGIYRSADAGLTWTHLGLDDAQQIPDLAVDPRDPNRLYAACHGTSVRPQRAARDLPLHRWRCPLDPGALQGREHRRVRHQDRSAGFERTLRLAVERALGALGGQQRIQRHRAADCSSRSTAASTGGTQAGAA
jgi:hypothetical protein